MCALKATIVAAVAIAETAVEDLKIAVKHVRRGAAVHVPGSAPTYSETLTDVYVIMTRFEAKEVDGDRIMSSDWKGLVFYRDGLPDFKTNDVLRVATTVDDILAGDYRIRYDDKVLAGSRVVLHQLHLRLG